MGPFSVLFLIAAFQQPAASPAPGALPPEIVALRARAAGGDAGAQDQLGAIYANGKGIPIDLKEALTWFRKAAEQGDATGEYSLAEMYALGQGVPVNVGEALKWLRKAADQGDFRAQFNLAVMYVRGNGVPTDEKQAADWMRKSAMQGYSQAQFALGVMCAEGKGVGRNPAEAADWYRKSAGQGNAAALNNLAYLLATTDQAGLRNPEEAITAAEQAVDTDRKNPVYRDTLARAYFEAGSPFQAAMAERYAVALKPSDASYQKTLDRYLAAVRPK